MKQTRRDWLGQLISERIYDEFLRLVARVIVSGTVMNHKSLGVFDIFMGVTSVFIDELSRKTKRSTS
jgi:hypothetical protein